MMSVFVMSKDELTDLAQLAHGDRIRIEDSRGQVVIEGTVDGNPWSSRHTKRDARGRVRTAPPGHGDESALVVDSVRLTLIRRYRRGGPAAQDYQIQSGHKIYRMYSR